MARRFPNDVVSQAQDVSGGWDRIDANLKIGTLDLASLDFNIQSTLKIEGELSKLEAELIEMRNLRDTAYTTLWDKVKRARAGVKAFYGDDSTEFELVGGTRVSDRKPPKRKISVN